MTTIEGHETVQRIVATDHVLINGLPIWRIDEAVPIENSRILLYVKEFGCYFDIAVKQMKGQGASYVREWKKLPKPNQRLLGWWLDQGQDFYESYHRAENLLMLYQDFKKTTSGDFAGRISELRGLGLLYPHPDKSDEFKLDYDRARKILEDDGILSVKSSLSSS